MRRSLVVQSDLSVDSILRESNCSDGSTHQHDAAHFAEALKHVGKKRFSHEGRRLHFLLLISYGALLPNFLSHCLVQMYGLCGYPHDAQKSFDAILHPSNGSRTVLIKALGHNGDVAKAHKAFSSICNPGIVAWNAIIGVYAKHRHSQNAMNLFRKMQVDGPAPSEVTFVCILDACSDLLTGLMIHSLVVMLCHEGNTIVSNALITMYGRCNDILDARSTFLNMYVRDLVTWSTLISQCTQNEKPVDALQLFCDMLSCNELPNHVTCVSVIDACTMLGKLDDGQVIHTIVVDCAHEKNLPVANALVNNYGKCGSLLDAKCVFDHIDECNLVTWSSLMGAYRKAGLCKGVLQLFHQMQSENIRLDEVTFLHVLDACTGLRDVAAGQEVHASLIEIGYTSVVSVGNALINFYAKCGCLSHARLVFITINPKNVVTWSTIISAAAQSGYEKEALSLFCDMQTTGIKANDVTLVSVLDACSTVMEGHILHTFIVLRYLEHSANVQTALVNLHDKVGSYHDAMYMFRKMSDKDVISWTSGIAACAHTEHGRKALNLFYQMLAEGVEPNSVTFVCVLDGCSSLVALEEGKEMHAAIIESGCDNDEVVMNALISMYGKCGNASEAVVLFRNTHKPGLVAWSAVLSACALNGQALTALSLANQMEEVEVQPNEVIFLSALTTCSHGGLIDQGLQYFIIFTKGHCLFPGEEHFACLIDLYCRAGQLGQAEQILELIPFAQAMSALASLLGACRFHGDGDRGLRCAKKLLDIDPSKAASYVDCANLYAAATIWE
ncbi:hypothetical protein L7F22_065824 [Adiantum nelumboides]|nr:hypothetical protein [Adiantum nelumboides]